jgi:hypothetical protein
VDSVDWPDGQGNRVQELARLQVVNLKHIFYVLQKIIKYTNIYKTLQIFIKQYKYL